MFYILFLRFHYFRVKREMDEDLPKMSECSPLDEPTRRPFSLQQLIGLFSVSFSYAFCFNTISTIVIPKETERLAPSRQSIWVGLVMASGAIGQLATPIVGSWSDRAGQRTPYLVYGTLVAITGIVCFVVVHTSESIGLLFVAQMVTTVGLSVQYSMVTALLNDFVSEEQTGKASGAMAILAILGSGAGYTLFAVNVSLMYSYCAYILATVVCLAICIFHIPEPEFSAHRRNCENKIHDAKHCTLCVAIPSPVKFPDFFFACVGRSLFNCGLGGQVYMVYYLRDVLDSKNSVQVTSTVAVMALVGGVVGALPSGILSDRVGKKPVIYLSVVICVASVVMFQTVSQIFSLQLVGFVYGLGNVAYLSVDYALGVQSLPRRVVDGRRLPLDAAKDLGMFAMSATVGQLIGQVTYGAILDQYGYNTGGGYKYHPWGFILIYSFSAVCFVSSGIATVFIKSVK